MSIMTLLERAREARQFYERNETKLGLSFMAFGFIVDSITLQRIDLFLENAILGSYLLIALLCIIVINLYHAGRFRSRLFQALSPWVTLPMQFAFGGLFSGYIVFYSRSASLIASWPFIILLLGILIGNEFARNKYTRFAYQVTLFYIALLSFSIFVVPVVTKHIGFGTFVLSGAVSLIGIGLVLALLRSIARVHFEKNKRYAIAGIVSVFIIFNVLYSTNIIPPIPLALKDIGVYHSVSRSGSEYAVTGEAPNWYEINRDTHSVFHKAPGESVYVFSSVFAPTDLRTRIFHQWFYYDETTESWEARDRISYAIAGGRDGGYRGYTRKTSLADGRWRVDVVTERNQLLGRIRFTVESVDEPTKLNEKKL